MLFGFFVVFFVIGGTIAAIMKWHHYGDHQVAPLRRSQGGLITAITGWLHCGDHGMAL